MSDTPPISRSVTSPAPGVEKPASTGFAHPAHREELAEAGKQVESFREVLDQRVWELTVNSPRKGQKADPWLLDLAAASTPQVESSASDSEIQAAALEVLLLTRAELGGRSRTKAPSEHSIVQRQTLAAGAYGRVAQLLSPEPAPEAAEPKDESSPPAR